MPPQAVVTQAKLELYTSAKTEVGASTMVGAYDILRTWTEDGATWNQARPGEPWEVAGCGGSSDRATDPVAISTMEWTKTWQALEGGDLDELVQRWVSDPPTNNGLVLAALTGQARQEWSIPSSQSVIDLTKGPRLMVTFYLEPQ